MKKKIVNLTKYYMYEVKSDCHFIIIIIIIIKSS